MNKSYYGKKKKPGQPAEMPLPTHPEVVPGNLPEEPESPVEPEILPEEEPDKPAAPSEFPK